MQARRTVFLDDETRRAGRPRSAAGYRRAVTAYDADPACARTPEADPRPLTAVSSPTEPECTGHGWRSDDLAQTRQIGLVEQIPRRLPLQPLRLVLTESRRYRINQTMQIQRVGKGRSVDTFEAGSLVTARERRAASGGKRVA